MVARTFDAINFRINDNTVAGTDGDVSWSNQISGVGDFYPTPTSNSNNPGFYFDVPASGPSSNYVTVTVEDTDGNSAEFQDEAVVTIDPNSAEQHTILGGNSSPVYYYNIFSFSQGNVGIAYLVIRDSDGVDNSNGNSSHQDWDAEDDYFLAINFNTGIDMSDFAGERIFFTPGFGDGTFEYADIDPLPGATPFTLPTTPCFSSSVMIQTPDGVRKAGDLKVGDLVMNRDGDAIAIRWVGARKINLSHAPADSNLRPVRITAGALGNGLPAADLTVSRQHRMLVEKGNRELPMDAQEALVSAIKLTALPGIFVDTEATEVEYIHFLFDRHEVIFAEGSATESLFLGPEALKAIHPEGVKEVLELFPELASKNYQPKSAAYIPPNKEQKQIAAALAQAS